jgi:hypothetical protein
MGGRVLAINEGFGYRLVLTVKNVKFQRQEQDRPSTTIVYGEQMMSFQDDPLLYSKYFSDKMDTSMVWAQLRITTDDDDYEQMYAIWPRVPVTPVLEERLSIVGAGRDPIRGYWVQFAGGPIRLFSQPDWWKEKEIYGI